MSKQMIETLNARETIVDICNPADKLATLVELVKTQSAIIRDLENRLTVREHNGKPYLT